MQAHRWPLGEELIRALERLEGGRTALVAGLEGPGVGFALARVWGGQPRTMLVVCAEAAQAEALVDDIRFFLPAQEQGQVVYMPAYEVSPYQGIQPPAEVTARRMRALWELVAEQAPVIVVASAAAVAALVPPPEYLVDTAVELRVGQDFGRDRLVEALAEAGYRPVGCVEEVGEMAVRGAVVDFWGPRRDEGVRVEFFGDEICEIRLFDPATQRSLARVEEAAVVACHPVALTRRRCARAAERLRALAKAHGWGGRKVAGLVELLREGVGWAGIEWWVGLFYERLATILEYLPKSALKVVVEPVQVQAKVEEIREQIAAEWAELASQGQPGLEPQELVGEPGELMEGLCAGGAVVFKALGMSEEDAIVMSSPRPVLTRAKGVQRLMEWVEGVREGGRVGIVACSSGLKRERVEGLLKGRGVRVVRLGAAVEAWPPAQELAEGVGVVEGVVSGGLEPGDVAISVVTDEELFGGGRVYHRPPPSRRWGEALAAVEELNPGQLVVHAEHGIGRYEGLVTMEVGGVKAEMIKLSYAGGDKLYVPVDRLGLISVYRGPEGAHPSLDKLGGKGWQRTRARVKKAVEEIAHELVELYAVRKLLPGHAYAPPGEDFRELEASFPYTETPDQARAIEEVIADLTSPRPMDRLVCGDVGFGKTEVAVRAAYLVAMEGRQVAVVVPTTVLAEQHYQTFTERLASTPLEIDVLSRFRSPAAQRKIIQRLKSGQLDIVIGTHRLLQEDVGFKDLGLVIIDEEQRFGVKAKERLKQLKRNVDVLTLSATPIPRTLQMSLSGIRELSLITTPPADRQAIRTYMCTFNPRTIREAIRRELARGGQVFFVHNRARELAGLARKIKELVPEARVGIAHGQLPERTLEKTMVAFVRGEVDVLVCTSIIESGLDIPRANTIIVYHAERFGLSQLYQLRGRVGRSNQRAYAYLVVGSEKALTPQARRRLKALMDHTHLGAGFAIAMRDLEIRGAGNLLGEAQSGHAAAVGYELYLQMLEEAIARLKGQPVPEGPQPQLKLHLEARIPPEYVPDESLRLVLYRRLATAPDTQALAELAREMHDRFGPMPKPVDNLFKAVEVKQLLMTLGADALRLGPGKATVFFGAGAKVEPTRVLELISRLGKGAKVSPEGRLELPLKGQDHPLVELKELLQYLAGTG